jgi:hypothetical protein
MSVADDIELSELLVIVAAVGVGGYLLWKFMSNATCILKPGTIPGVTGATVAQTQAAAAASCRLKPGGSVIWSCGSDLDYMQPCNKIVTEARHNGWDYVPIVNNWTTPVKYTDVPISCYAVPCGGVLSPQFACCFGKASVPF